MTSWLRTYRTGILAVLTLIVWSTVLYFLPPDVVLESIGIGNAYLISFLVSLVAGFSVFTGTAAYATVIEFARAGANPLYLGLLSGIGIFLSDSIFYYVIVRGRSSLEVRFKNILSSLHGLFEKIPDYAVYIIIYLFCSFGPIPNDIILAALMLGNYEYKRFWPILLAGDITFMLFLSYIFH